MLAQRFPGGVIQFAQMAEQFPEEIIEGIMAAQAVDGDDAFANQPGFRAAEGGMPGAFMPDEQDEDPTVAGLPETGNEEESDEDNDGDEDEYDRLAVSELSFVSASSSNIISRCFLFAL
jgi:hypothetical protein